MRSNLNDVREIGNPNLLGLRRALFSARDDKLDDLVFINVPVKSKYKTYKFACVSNPAVT